MKPPVILHCSATREDHGGIQSVLAYHLQRDAGLGFAPRFLSYFDRMAKWPGDCVSLAGRGWETVGSFRRRFAQAAVTPRADAVVYHDGWGLDWFAPLDGAARRIVFMHVEQPHFDELIRSYASMVDGFLTVSQALADRIRRVLPNFPPERIRSLVYFIDPPPGMTEAAPAASPPAGPVRFGYAGRIEREHKRLDRLPALLAELDRRNVDYVFELMGDGSYQVRLQQLVAGHPRLRFIGWKQGRDYWQTLASWRALVLLSDFEGISRVGLEAMACGVVPLMPEYSPGAAELLGPVGAAGLYPVGDVGAAAGLLAKLATLSPGERVALGSACRVHVAPRTPDNYFASYGAFLREILAAPARAQPPQAPAWHNAMLLGVYTRLFPRRF